VGEGEEVGARRSRLREKERKRDVLGLGVKTLSMVYICVFGIGPLGLVGWA
jgi:hypothetical protein